MASDQWSTATAVLRLSTRLIDEIQAGVAAAGFPDVTPLHGFAFARIAEGETTVGDLSTHLGISKQAAAQLTHRLLDAGYVSRRAHPTDGRAQLIELTDRGRACTVAARRAAERAVDGWRRELSAHDADRLESGLIALAAPVRTLRPAR